MQPPKRGLSLEEKRSKLLEVFHESKDVFVLKVGVVVCRGNPRMCMHAFHVCMLSILSPCAVLVAGR